MLVVSEVTGPPFLGSHLEDFYVEITVLSQKASAHKPGDGSIENFLRSSGNKRGRGSSLEIKKSKSRSSLVHRIRETS